MTDANLAAELAALRAFTIHSLAAIEASLLRSAAAVVPGEHRERLAASGAAVTAAAVDAGLEEGDAAALALSLAQELEARRQSLPKPR